MTSSAWICTCSPPLALLSSPIDVISLPKRLFSHIAARSSLVWDQERAYRPMAQPSPRSVLACSPFDDILNRRISPGKQVCLSVFLSWFSCLIDLSSFAVPELLDLCESCRTIFNNPFVLTLSHSYLPSCQAVVALIAANLGVFGLWRIVPEATMMSHWTTSMAHMRKGLYHTLLTAT